MKTIFIFEDVILRLKNRLNITQDNDFANIIGMKPATYHARKKAQSLPFDEILSIANQENIDLNWLFFGIYPKFKPAITIEEHKNINYIDEFTVKIRHEFSLVPFYDVEASAGNGSLIEQEQKLGEMAFRNDWLAAKGLNSSHCALIKARGDSMEPTLFDGDLLLVDLRVNEVKDDAIYILLADNRLIVKRVQVLFNDTLAIISDNPFYATQKIKLDDTEKLNVVGKLRWHGHEI